MAGHPGIVGNVSEARPTQYPTGAWNLGMQVRVPTMKARDLIEKVHEMANAVDRYGTYRLKYEEF